MDCVEYEKVRKPATVTKIADDVIKLILKNQFCSNTGQFATIYDEDGGY